MKNFVKLKPDYKADDRNGPIYSSRDRKLVNMELDSRERLIAYADKLKRRYGINNEHASVVIGRSKQYFAELKQKTTHKYIKMIELGYGNIVRGYRKYMATEANGHDLKGVKDEINTNSTE